MILGADFVGLCSIRLSEPRREASDWMDFVSVEREEGIFTAMISNSTENLVFLYRQLESPIIWLLTCL